LVANLFSARGAIVAHSFLPCVEIVAGAATLASHRFDGKRAAGSVVSRP
jgi:hypothetical protein